MNNYKQKSIDDNELYEKMDDILFRLKEIFFGDSLYKFSNFELLEINRVKEKNENVMQSVSMRNSEKLDLFEFDNNLLALVLDKQNFEKYLQRKDEIIKENQTLNFKLKSLYCQKKDLINKFDLSALVKIGDKIKEVMGKINIQKEKVTNFESNINNTIQDFFDKYLALLNDISNNLMTKDSKVKSLKATDEKILNYYKINKFVFYINSIKNEINFEIFIDIFKNCKDFQLFFGSNFAYVVGQVMYVGTDI